MRNYLFFKTIFYSPTSKIFFRNKGFALSLVLKVRVFGTRKWSITLIAGGKSGKLNDSGTSI